MNSQTGTLKCLMCGRIYGKVIDRSVMSVSGVPLPPPGNKPRCPSCGGTLYFDKELDQVSLQV